LDPLDPLDAARKRTGIPWLDLTIGASAMLIAVVSLIVALRQSQIMERQLAASVWPYLQYGTSNQTDDGKAVVSLDVENVGVGPARVHSISLRYRDKPIRGVRELLDACCADLLASEGKPNWSISTLHDQVLAPNRPKSFFMLPNSATNARYWERLNTERFKITLKVCYCSVLDQCWMLDSTKDDREAIASCPASRPDDYRD
jgi:hypothetical protein